MDFKQRIKNWLFKEEIENMQVFVKKIELDYGYLKDLSNRVIKLCSQSKTELSAATVELNKCKKFMNEICDVGIDVGFSDEHSWAVICVAGKPEYVKFMPLTHKDTMEIISFLKHFQYSNKVIDSPFGFKEMIKNYILKGET